MIAQNMFRAQNIWWVNEGHSDPCSHHHHHPSA